MLFQTLLAAAQERIELTTPYFLPDKGIRKELIRAGDFKQESGRALTNELLDLRKPPTALFVVNNLMTVGSLSALHQRGLRIPEDVSVVGFDDLPFARVFAPPLTTIAIDPEELGAAAFEVLAAVMAGEPGERGRILPVELVVRESTGPPPAG